MITDYKSLPAGTKFYQVSEEIWYVTGQEADRDFVNNQDFETLAEAVEYAKTVQTERRGNRLYIDLMQKSENGASGLPVFAGYQSELLNTDDDEGWRPWNFTAMGMEIPSLV